MSNTSTNVSAGKPSINGAIWVAPANTTLPTSATATLDNAFESVGYISTDGLVNSNNASSSSVGAWGGDNPLTLQGARTDTFKYTLLECLNIAALKLIHGSENVSGSLSTGITIKVNNNELEDKAIVIDMALRDNVLKRICIPLAKVSNVGDVTYKDDDAIKYEVTVSCSNDASGQSHYEYIIKDTTSTSTSTQSDDEVTE